MATKKPEPELFAPLHVAVLNSPIGKLWIESDGALITRLSFDPIPVRQAKVPKVLMEAQWQLDAYFAGTRKQFELPVQRKGTRFQKLVWDALDTIPFGRTMTYQGIGDRIGGKAIGRTVGNACGSNPIPIIVPCHRVIAVDGLLTGYVGGLWRKKWLLEHEGALPKELF
ncbi:MAG: methylated-DNA--[protein]-cysteine S-methyltransferase [Flavobacteriales bacterium]|jgi:methylated-DNA-[protein]-cysteine S-methyltransferase|nr:methylated-DNA--[protein]-cysteine S-methyltransferase [Flavobacteriales bacterium]HOY29455.1 methylated-DNA--[protein]-cysteine S-methyltransferase [Flavobacteriales bacterium]